MGIIENHMEKNQEDEREATTGFGVLGFRSA